MRIKVYIAAAFSVLLNLVYAQQQTLYTNYLLNQYIYNPAYAGVEDGTQFNLGYRNQWLGFDGGPRTYLLSGYGKLKKKPNMAVGGILTTERIGLFQRSTFYGTYSYHLKINKNASINFGLGVGGIQHKVRVYDARPYDKDDNFLASDVLRAFAFDANAGFYFYTKNFFLGFSDQQMPSSRILWKNSSGKNTNHFYTYAGYNIHLDKDWMIQPSVLVRSNSPAPYQFELLAKAIYKEMIWAGLSYRQRSSASFMIGCRIDKQFTFGYSYDLTLTALNKYSSGSHEIVLSYLIPFKRKKSKSELIQDADEEELNKIDNSVKTNLRNKKKKENEQKTETETEKQAPKPGEIKTDKPAEPEPKTEQGTEPKTEMQQEQKQPETGNAASRENVIGAPATSPEQGAPKPESTEVQKSAEPQQENIKQPETETKKEGEPKK